MFSRESDTAGLVESRLRRGIVATKKAELVARKQPVDGLDFAAISADREDYLRQLTTVYRKAWGANAKLPEPAAPPPDTAPVPDTPEARIARVEQAVRERIEVTTMTCTRWAARGPRRCRQKCWAIPASIRRGFS